MAGSKGRVLTGAEQVVDGAEATRRRRIVTVGLVHAGDTDGPHRETVYSPNAFKVPYLGVDGIFTNKPDVLRTVVDSARTPPPAHCH